MYPQIWRSPTQSQRMETLGKASENCKMEVVDIGSMDSAFASGANRMCFVHPLYRDRCIKILRPDMSAEKKRSTKKLYKRFRPTNSFDANAEEYANFKNIDKYYDREAWDYVLRHYGFVKTNHGNGLCVELIRDRDGRISITLKQYIWEFGKTQEVILALAAFERGWQRLGLPSRTLDPLNILVQRQGDQIRRLVVVDGLGWPQLVPLGYWFKPIARREAAFRLRMLHRAVDNLLARKQAGSGFGEGWLDVAKRQA